MHQEHAMSRRPFATTYLDCDAVWEPLEAIARVMIVTRDLGHLITRETV